MVKLITSTSELGPIRQHITAAVGFVPTMGNLHAGHMSLLTQALRDFPTVFFSIFVNPKQFGPSEDFARYPRTLEQDLSLIRSMAEQFPNASIFVYAPTDPGEVFSATDSLTISVPQLAHQLEGELRPGHFDGVATVVYRLFELIKPQRAYFGLKDYQQYLVISQMVKDLFLPVEIIGMPIVRDEQGLALSSRNQYLSPQQKVEALTLSKTLQMVSQILGGKKANLTLAQLKIQEVLQDKRWNYLELRDAQTLSAELEHSTSITLLGVYQLGTTRLLDNLQQELA
jgi:pantoate--beta-alanine ligase